MILELPEAAPWKTWKIAGPMEKGLWKHWPEPVEDVEMKPEPTEDVVMKSEPGSEEWVGLYHNNDSYLRTVMRGGCKEFSLRRFVNGPEVLKIVFSCRQWIDLALHIGEHHKRA